METKHVTLGATALAILLVASAVYFTSSKGTARVQEPIAADNVSMVDGKQVIEIRAKGGYSPRVSVAKAGVPTLLRFYTNGTFDCSAAVRIPSRGVSRNLDFNGTTDIAIDSPKEGTLQGLCAMGMYSFIIKFEK